MQHNKVRDAESLNICKYIDLKVTLSKDTVYLGDTVRICISLINNTDTCISIIPDNAYACMMHSFEAFLDPIIVKDPYILKLRRGLNQKQTMSIDTIEARGCRDESFDIVVTDNYFYKKDNAWVVVYVSSDRYRNQFYKYPKHVSFGGIASSDFNIYLKE